MTYDNDSTRALRSQIDSLTIQRDAAEALARSNSDPAHARALADAVADRLFVEGERDAALHDLAVARDHLEAANNAHMEAERDCTDATRLLDEAVAKAERNETARRDAVALWTKQAEHCRQMVADLAISRDQTDRAERISSDRLNLLKAALVEKDALVADRDAAQQMVAEMRAKVDNAEQQAANAVGALELVKGDGDFDQLHEVTRGAVDDALSAPIAGRWCLASERDSFLADSQRYMMMLAAAERRESELGLQVVAQSARLRLADGVVENARAHDHDDDGLACALAAWDDVPGMEP